MIALAMRCLFAFATSPAPLGDHVSHVVRMCAEPQMHGVDARRVVATVQHMQSVGNWPNEESISSAVGHSHPYPTFAQADDSVSVLIFAPVPENATRCSFLADAVKKSVDHWAGRGFDAALWRTVDGGVALVLDYGWVCQEMATASVTDAGYFWNVPERIIALLRAKFGAAFFDFGRVGKKVVATSRANASDFRRLAFRHGRLLDRWLCSGRVDSRKLSARPLYFMGGGRE